MIMAVENPGKLCNFFLFVATLLKCHCHKPVGNSRSLERVVWVPWVQVSW